MFVVVVKDEEIKLPEWMRLTGRRGHRSSGVSRLPLISLRRGGGRSKQILWQVGIIGNSAHYTLALNHIPSAFVILLKLQDLPCSALASRSLDDAYTTSLK